MANQPKQSQAPAPRDNGNGEKAPETWTPPPNDQEFTFTSIQEAPNWVDKNWASFDRGPALALPAGDLWGTGPYVTTTARVGDKVVYTAAKGAMPAKFTVIPGDPAAEGEGTPLPPQQSPAALEDLLRAGYIAPDELGADAKAQVAVRSPRFKGLIEGDENNGADVPVPEKQSIADQLKLD